MRTTAACFLAVALMSFSGCGANQAAHKLELGHFALAYHEYYAAHGRAPARLEDLREQSSTFPTVYRQIQDGQIVVIWNAMLRQNSSENDEYVLAYEKAVPDKGGWVIGGGGLVRQLTAGEFQKRPKIERAAE